MKRDDDGLPGPLVATLWVFSVAFILYSLYAAQVAFGPQDSFLRLAAFGDSFGVFSALFAGAAFVAVMWTLHIQRIELRDHRKEFQRMAQTQKETLALERSLARVNLNLVDFKYGAINSNAGEGITLSFSIELSENYGRPLADIKIKQTYLGQRTDLQTLAIWKPGERRQIQHTFYDEECKANSGGALLGLLGVEVYYNSVAGEDRVYKALFVRNRKIVSISSVKDFPASDSSALDLVHIAVSGE